MLLPLCLLFQVPFQVPPVSKYVNNIAVQGWLSVFSCCSRTVAKHVKCIQVFEATSASQASRPGSGERGWPLLCLLGWGTRYPFSSSPAPRCRFLRGRKPTERMTQPVFNHHNYTYNPSPITHYTAASIRGFIASLTCFLSTYETRRFYIFRLKMLKMLVGVVNMFTQLVCCRWIAYIQL